MSIWINLKAKLIFSKLQSDYYSYEAIVKDRPNYNGFSYGFYTEKGKMKKEELVKALNEMAKEMSARVSAVNVMDSMTREKAILYTLTNKPIEVEQAEREAREKKSEEDSLETLEEGNVIDFIKAKEAIEARKKAMQSEIESDNLKR